MQAREPQLPGSGHRARALQSGEEWGEESVLPQCQEGGASAVPAGRRFTAPRSWEVTEKKRCALPKDAACSTGGGLASGWARLLGGPGSSRLIIQPLQGAAVGAGEGQGSEGAVEIRNTPSPATHAQSWCWEGSLLHCVIRELGLLRTRRAAPRGSDVTSRDGHHPLSMAPLWARVLQPSAPPVTPAQGRVLLFPLTSQ